MTAHFRRRCSGREAALTPSSRKKCPCGTTIVPVFFFSLYAAWDPSLFHVVVATPAGLFVRSGFSAHLAHIGIVSGRLWSRRLCGWMQTSHACFQGFDRNRADVLCPDPAPKEHQRQKHV